MSIKSGFFNSVNHDRTYDAEDMASIFDGAFTDGVFFNVKVNGSLENNQRFYVSSSGMGVSVGTGKAWFDHTYTVNDEPLYLNLEPAEGVLNRYDAIVLEVNNTLQVRENTIKVITGTPSNEPEKPGLIKTSLLNHYALAYVYVPAGAESILQSNIENVVGTEETPYAAGLIPMDQDIPFNFGIDGNGRYGYKEAGSSEVTPFTPFKFGIDDDGNYGYYKAGADTVTPFKTGQGSGGTTVKKLATVGGNTTINLINKEGFEDIWENLTTDNFFYRINSISVSKTQNQDTGSYDQSMEYQNAVKYQWNVTTGPLNISISPRLSYNADTGNLSVTGMTTSGTSWLRAVLWEYISTRQYHDATKYDVTTVSLSADIWVAY